MAKRLVDLLIASLALLLLAPVLVALAAWIKLDSVGPVFFRQERVGRHGRLFRIHKLRTMRVHQDTDAPAITVGADPRVTRAGHFLRASKLDELPQLLDVLRGDMSLVGPRPEVPQYVALYPEASRQKILSVRPGITDPASIKFRQESELLARATDPQQEYLNVVMPAKLKLAEAYVDQSSLALDFKIMWQTLRVLASSCNNKD